MGYCAKFGRFRSNGMDISRGSYLCLGALSLSTPDTNAHNVWPENDKIRRRRVFLRDQPRTPNPRRAGPSAGKCLKLPTYAHTARHRGTTFRKVTKLDEDLPDPWRGPQWGGAIFVTSQQMFLPFWPRRLLTWSVCGS